MRLLVFSVLPVSAMLAFAACGSSNSSSDQTTSTGGGSTTETSSPSSTSSSTSTSSSSSGTGGTGGGMVSHGDCMTDADCGGKPCMPLTPGGFKVCINIPDPATMCQMPGDPGCCTNADCTGNSPTAGCYAPKSLQFCGGAMLPYNECVDDQCTKDSDCMGGQPSICAPAGAFGYPKRQCFPAYCKTDADCNKMPGGACIVVGENPCCTLPSPDGLACVYPGDCVKDKDCPGGTCTIDPTKSESACGPADPGCPP